MNPTQTKLAEQSGSARIGLGIAEFIIIIALMTASISMGIDSMLPALPNIGQSLAVANPNDTQLVIGVYFLGFGICQLFFGSLSDAYGRRNILLGGLIFYTVTLFAAAWSGSLTTLLVLRFIQGVGAAAVRITTLAIVRDCFGGREMARVMSYVTIVFMIMPMVAPFVGQMIVAHSNWQWIFIALGIASAVLFLIAFLRMKETLPDNERLPLSVSSVVSGFKTVLTNRVTCGYMIGLTLFTGVICAYVVSVQQVFGEVYGLGEWFPIAFAATAAGTAVAQFANGYFVRSYGMRRISHVAMIIFTVLGAFGYVAGTTGLPSFLFTYVLISVMLMMFAVITTNFMAISLEPMGHLAGTAAAITSSISTTGGVLLGGIVGQMFDGTVQPLIAGFTIFGALTIIATLWAEKGRLFTHPGDDPQLEPGMGHV
ncbi:multidrug effflux MFS transporter [Rhizobium leucaenae]|uniref:Bcr/CflA family efflux transporter n=1 Tax=Rhizobium leucaenae TaxID=29450 RepID=A0A7W7ELU4_9HYPH|nr:multidrug effflux MFS transporter [Rhizobium leucaenae]MBB4569852.1 DHA1 family bicyclomycin/chloramphenicol resistance-like MFS transporter [Rhizobium leucaenae]MBB6299635.1 DHA1 family bicyclomycin/chloramphenicol resistance-like MFS transporter [Rhizobium leucaenae]